jgi:hypothetical protein
MKKIMVQFNFPGTTLKQYDQAWADCRATGQLNPKGMIHHVGGMNGNNLLVCDVWESQEAFNKFGEVLMPILKKNNFADVTPVITPVHYEQSGAETLVTH